MRVRVRVRVKVRVRVRVKVRDRVSYAEQVLGSFVLQFDGLACGLV